MSGWGEIGKNWYFLSEQEQIKTAQKYLDGGGDVNATNNDGITLLMDAAGNGRLDLARLLLSNDADLEAKKTDSGATALLCAAWNEEFLSAKFLIEAGANVNAVSDLGMTALMIFAWQGDPDAVNYLIEAGADINAQDRDGETAADHAREGGNPEIAALLEKVASRLK